MSSHITSPPTLRINVHPPPQNVCDVQDSASDDSFYVNDSPTDQGAGASVPPSVPQPTSPDRDLLTPVDNRSQFGSPTSSVEYLGSDYDHSQDTRTNLRHAHSYQDLAASHERRLPVSHDALSPAYSLHPPRSFIDAMLPEEKDRKKKTAREWFTKPLARMGDAVGGVFRSRKGKRKETSEAPSHGAPSANSSTAAVHDLSIPAQPPRFLQILEDSVASRSVLEVQAEDQPSQSPHVPLRHPSPQPSPQPFRPSAGQGQSSQSSQVPTGEHHHHHQPQSSPRATPSTVHPRDPHGASNQTPYSRYVDGMAGRISLSLQEGRFSRNSVTEAQMPQIFDEMLFANLAVEMQDSLPNFPPSHQPDAPGTPASPPRSTSAARTRFTNQRNFPNLNDSDSSARLADIFKEFDAEANRDLASTYLPTFQNPTQPSDDFIERNAVAASVLSIAQIPEPQWPGLDQPPSRFSPSGRMDDAYSFDSDTGEGDLPAPSHHAPAATAPPHLSSSTAPPHLSSSTAPPESSPSSPRSTPSYYSTQGAPSSPSLQHSAATRSNSASGPAPARRAMPRRDRPPTPRPQQHHRNRSSGRIPSYYFGSGTNGGAVDGLESTSSTQRDTGSANPTRVDTHVTNESRQDGMRPPPASTNPGLGIALPLELLQSIDVSGQFHSPVFVLERWGCFVRAPEGGFYPLKWYVPYVAVETTRGFTVYRTDDGRPADWVTTRLWLSWIHVIMMSAQIEMALEGLRRRNWRGYQHRYHRTGLESFEG